MNLPGTMIALKVGSTQPNALLFGELGQCHGVDSPRTLNCSVCCARLRICQPCVLLVLLLYPMTDDGFSRCEQSNRLWSEVIRPVPRKCGLT